MKQKRAAIYLRVSTTMQDYEMQREDLIKHFNSLGIEVVKTFEEKESGIRDDREQFIELCKLTREDVEYIGVWAFDRLGRNLATMAKTVEDFNRKKICLHTIKENFVSLDENFNVSSTTTLMIGFWGATAEMERINLKERTRRGKEQKMKEGRLSYCAHAPFGYEIKDKKLVVKEEEAEIVRKIYGDYLKGLSMEDLVKVYGICRTTIGKVLTSTTYIGRATNKILGGTMVETPKIIDVETYNKVQEVIDKRRIGEKGRKQRHYNPLARKVKCSECGKSLTLRDKWLQCNCGRNTVRYEAMVEAVKGCLRKHYKEYVREQKDIKVQMKRLKELKEKERGIYAIIEAERKNADKAERKLKLLMEGFTMEELAAEVKAIKKIKETIAMREKEIVRIKTEMEDIERMTKVSERELDTNRLIERHLTSAKVYKLGKRGYKYIRVVIDDVFRYEVVIDTASGDKSIYAAKGEIDNGGLKYREMNEASPANGVKAVYSISGQAVSAPRKGVNIVVGSDGTVKKVMRK